MKKLLMGMTAIVLITTGCGKDKNSVSIPNEGSNANAFTANIMAQGGMPKTKDAVSFNQKKFYRTVGNFKCAYRVETDVVVTRANQNNIRLRVRNESNQGRRNSAYCPTYHPTMRETRTQAMTMNEFVQRTTQKINSALNPNVFCAEKRDWCSNFRLIQKTDTTKHGIPAVLVEAEFQNRNGHIYNRKVWISKVSLLQNVFEMEMVNVRTGEIVDFKRLKNRRRGGDRRPRF